MHAQSNSLPVIQRSHAVYIALSLFIVAASVVAIAIARGRHIESTVIPPQGWSANSPKAGRIAVQGKSDSRAFPIVLLNLTRFGFEPAAMNIPAGKCQLAIRNITGLDEVDLQVARKNGERLLIEKYPKGKRHWEKILQLPVGDYVISVPDNPQWTFNLKATPPGK